MGIVVSHYSKQKTKKDSSQLGLGPMFTPPPSLHHGEGCWLVGNSSEETTSDQRVAISDVSASQSNVKKKLEQFFASIFDGNLNQKTQNAFQTPKKRQQIHQWVSDCQEAFESLDRLPKPI